MATGAVLIGVAAGGQVNMVVPMAQTLRSTCWMPRRCAMIWRMEDGIFSPAIQIQIVGRSKNLVPETDAIGKRSQIIS